MNEFKRSQIPGALMDDVDEGTNEVPIVATIGVGKSQARERARMGWDGKGQKVPIEVGWEEDNDKEIDWHF